MATQIWLNIVSGNGLSPARRQAITWTNAGLLSMGLMETSVSEIWIGILSFALKKMFLKMSSAKTAEISPRGDEVIGYSYTLSREYRVMRYRYSRLLFTSEDRICANLRVQEQSTNMTSQYQCPTFAWRHRSTVVTSQY